MTAVSFASSHNNNVSEFTVKAETADLPVVLLFKFEMEKWWKRIRLCESVGWGGGVGVGGTCMERLVICVLHHSHENQNNQATAAPF